MLTYKTNVEQHQSGSVFKRGLAHVQIGYFRLLSSLGYLGKRGGARCYPSLLFSISQSASGTSALGLLKILQLVREMTQRQVKLALLPRQRASLSL